MFNKRVIFILFLLTVAIGTVSSVGAVDMCDDTVNATGDNAIEVNDNNVIEEDFELNGLDSCAILESSDGGTFVALSNEMGLAEEGSTAMLENDSQSNVSLVSLLNSSSSNSTAIPSSYDSRDYGYISPAGDKDNGGDCWAYAGISTLEASINKITGLHYDFSDTNMENVIAMYSQMGLNFTTSPGGYDTMLMAYLTNWYGPINDLHSNYSALPRFDECLFHVQNIKFLPARQNSSDNDLIKRAIMDYGAVAVAFNWNNVGFTAVSLVGWKDNYNNYDSLGNYAKGAWIFKSSWGSDFADNGFGYISFDTPFASDVYDYYNAYTFVFNKDENYICNYQYDVGLTDYVCSDSHVWYSNKFTSKDLQYLSAFSTYFRVATNYTVSVYLNETLVLSQSGHADSGYHTVPFNERIAIPSGVDFVIMIENSNEGYNYAPVCQADGLYHVNIESNVSFLSFDGKNWMDLNNINDSMEFLFDGLKANTSQVACIKAFTSLIELDVITINVTEFESANVNEEIIIVVSFNGDSLELIDGTLISININGNDYYAMINGSHAELKVKFDEGGTYALSAQYRNNVFASNIVEFNFTVKKKNVSLSAKGMSKVYGGNEKLTVSLKDNGNPIRNAVIKFKANGKTTSIKTDAKGQASMPINFAPDKYGVIVTYGGNGTYLAVSKTVKVTVKKATSKIIASKKTFKLKDKTKKYTITVKNNKNKVMGGATVKITVNKKTYAAKTNKKGVATFKLTKLTKKGSHKATITYGGSKYYNKTTKKVTLYVK